MQYHVGHVRDEEGILLEVWIEKDSVSEHTEHVYLMYGGSQCGDFPFGQPDNNELCRTAQKVAAGEAKLLSVKKPSTENDDNSVIDEEQTQQMRQHPQVH